MGSIVQLLSFHARHICSSWGVLAVEILGRPMIQPLRLLLCCVVCRPDAWKRLSITSYVPFLFYVCLIPTCSYVPWVCRLYFPNSLLTPVATSPFQLPELLTFGRLLFCLFLDVGKEFLDIDSKDNSLFLKVVILHHMWNWCVPLQIFALTTKVPWCPCGEGDIGKCSGTRSRACQQ